MLDTKSLRKADFITSIVLFLFGVWVLSEAFKMPMRDTYGGVRNVWYVSPALMPLIVGFGVATLAVVLFVHSIRAGGARDFIASLRTVSLSLSESSRRFFGILLALLTFVYFYIPRIDFALSIAIFLAYFIPAYYYDSVSLLRRLSLAYGGAFLLLLVIYATGTASAINARFEFSTDVVALALIIAISVYARILAGRDGELRRKYRVGLVATIVVPLVLTPIFRFGLYVPLPHEGGIVQLMQLIYYSLR